MTSGELAAVNWSPESPLKALQRTDITHQTDRFDETVQQTSH